MSVRLEFNGFDELLDALTRLPDDLVGEATEIVMDTASTAMTTMRAEYPAGELRQRLYQSTMKEGRFGIGVLIKNTSGFAWLWDHGSKLRHTTGRGRRAHSTGAEWGGQTKTPPHTFGRTMGRARLSMVQRLWRLLESHGLVVSNG